MQFHPDHPRPAAEVLLSEYNFLLWEVGTDLLVSVGSPKKTKKLTVARDRVYRAVRKAYLYPLKKD